MNLVELDGVVVNIECGLNAASAIHTAMCEGHYSANDTLDGLFYVLSKLYDDVKILRSEIDRRSNEIKTEHTGGHTV